MLELLDATLPELRRGLTGARPRTVAYELFEKLGYGAVARHRHARACSRSSAPAPTTTAPATARSGRSTRRSRASAPLLAPLGIRTECENPACPLGAAAVVPLQLSDGPAGAVVAYATAGSPLDEAAVETLEPLGRQLSAQLQLSELHTATTTALQAQMEPHFVFNALNTIASFIRTDPERARTARARVRRPPAPPPRAAGRVRHARGGAPARAQLPRRSSRRGSAPQLEVTIDAAPDALAVRLPPLLVQPLVENAIKHGKTDRPLHLLVRARVRRGRLRVTVRDDGRGIARDVLDRVLEPGVGEGTGLGLANVNLRLTAHYGEGVRLRSFPFGTVVRLEVPVG